MEQGPQEIDEKELLKKLDTFLESEGCDDLLKSDGAYRVVAGLGHKVFKKLTTPGIFTEEEISYIRYQASRPYK